MWDFQVPGLQTKLAECAGYKLKSNTKVKEFLHKEQLADGFIVSNENPYYQGNQDYLVYHEKKLGETIMACHCRVRLTCDAEKVIEHVQKVEKMCLSLAAQ